jgi:hypothetical protein
MVRRYLHAFWGALRMTVRGEVYTPPPIQQSPLTAWISQYLLLVNDVLRAANQNDVDQATRKQIKLRLDGRPMSLETALMTLKFHAAEEYPSLVRQGTGRGVQNTLYATNMNDRYWISRMVEAPELQKPDVQKALATLDTHLNAIPKID